jgi:hypothetical protein
MAPYTDWADWAGDHPEQAEAELRKGRPEPTCEHAEVDNQGVCTDCGDEVEGWEPDEQQLDQHHGTSVAA